MQIVCRISENGAEIEKTINGVSYWHNLNIDDFLKALNNSVYQNQEETFASPMLPLGTIGYQERNNSYSVTMYREPRITGITFEERNYQVGYPGIIYVFTVTNKVLSGTRMFAVTDQLLRPETEIYRYPYFNAWADGRICMGINHIPIEYPWQLHKMPDIIASMPANNGLPINNQSGMQGDSLLRAVENKPFPNEWLTPADKKLKNLFK